MNRPKAGELVFWTLVYTAMWFFLFPATVFEWLVAAVGTVALGLAWTEYFHLQENKQA